MGGGGGGGGSISGINNAKTDKLKISCSIHWSLIKLLNVTKK